MLEARCDCNLNLFFNLRILQMKAKCDCNFNLCLNLLMLQICYGSDSSLLKYSNGHAWFFDVGYVPMTILSPFLLCLLTVIVIC